MIEKLRRVTEKYSIAQTQNYSFNNSRQFGYQLALAGFEISVIVALAIVVMFGREEKGRSFQREENVAAP